MSPMVRETVTYYHYDHRHDPTLVVDHWQDAEVVRAQELAKRDRLLAELRSEREDPTADLRGKVVARVDYDYDDSARISAALLERDDPKSWDESREFYDLVHERRGL